MRPQTSSIVILETIYLASSAYITVFVVCDLCERATSLVGEIDVIGELNWYTFPHEMQKVLPTILRMSQQPCELKFFGQLSCSRDTYKKVIVFGKIKNANGVTN